MKNELSINADKNEIDLENNNADYSVALLKSAIGNVPVVGSILNEVVGIVIPNQKTDRIKLFVEVLALKLEHIEKDVLEAKMKTEEFTDLFEDALPQAARAITDERREYIATFLKNSLTNEDLDHIGEKKLLSLLNELNDAEIIFLKHEALPYHAKNEFYESHEAVLDFMSLGLPFTQASQNKSYLHKSFPAKLQSLGLTTTVFKRVNKGEIPEFDEKTGRLKADGQEATGLGRLLLKYIDESFIYNEYE